MVPPCGADVANGLHGPHKVVSLGGALHKPLPEPAIFVLQYISYNDIVKYAF